jgi:hypothetical protein
VLLASYQSIYQHYYHHIYCSGTTAASKVKNARLTWLPRGKQSTDLDYVLLLL